MADILRIITQAPLEIPGVIMMQPVILSRPCVFVACVFVFSVMGLSCNIKGFKDSPYQTPRVTVDTPAGVQAQDVELTYRLTEVDGSKSDISIEFSTNGGATWNPGTLKTGGNSVQGYPYPGVTRQLVWDSFADGLSGSHTVRIKLTARKVGFGIKGPPGETEDFQLQNPDFPVISWIAKPEGTIRQVPLTFMWKLDTPATPIANYYYGLNEDPPTSTTSNTSVIIMPPTESTHTFRVYASSVAGLNSSVLTTTFTCDNAAANQAPTVVITSGPSGLTIDNTPTFEYLGADPDGSITGYYVSIDTDPPDIWVTGNTWTAPELTCSSHTFYVVAQDNDGANSNILTLSFMVDPTPAPNTIHVSEEFGNDNNDGSSWSNAVASISKGIELGNDDQTVLVADGIYTGPENRKIRLFGKGLTVKSVNGPAACIIDCQFQEKGFYLVDGEISTSVIDGFTIINGDSAVDICGGGIYISSNPIIRNCIIKDCIREWGGGIGIDGSGPEIVNCVFENNSAYNRGSGIYIKSGNANIIDCTFRQNSALTGGGIYTLTDNSNIIGCTIVNNHAVDGGGLKVRQSHTKFINCIIASNTASFEGGGLLTFNSAEPVFTNCVFENNSAVDSYGGGIRCASDSDKVVLNNCIIWNNHTEVNMGDGISHQVTTIELNSCVFDNGANFFGGSGTRIINSCITSDPQFINAAAGNYDLQISSSCIDTGNNSFINSFTPPITTDIGGNPRIVDGVAPFDGPKVDIGAYEYQP
ncbi:MAG: right-handed parallel beta-helix repeat-containing protein [Planctomycetota bacterium]|jgi:predicted outer membrane repeat protein